MEEPTPPESEAHSRKAASSAGHSRRLFGFLSVTSFIALMAAACSPAALLNKFTDRNGYEITHSIAYGRNARQVLDVYRPDGARAAPVVVFFFGGSWQGGDKETYLFLAAALAQRGYVTVVADYRVYPEVRYPKFIEDGALAVRWTKNNAVRFGGDPGRIFVMGHSAGAYIAAMLAINGRYLNAVGLDPHRDLAGLIGVSGPYDFLPLQDETLKIIFGGANRPETQPISYVTRGLPPSLLVTGLNDGTVDPDNATRLAARLREFGNRVKVIKYPGVNHLTIVGSFASSLRFLAPVLSDVDHFIGETAGLSVNQNQRPVAANR
jgi:acetyl esterase/lipase